MLLSQRTNFLAALQVGALILASALILMVPAVINGAPFVFGDTPSYQTLGELIFAPDAAAAIGSLQNDQTFFHAAVSETEYDRLLERAASHLGARSVAYSVFLQGGVKLASMWGPALGQCLFVAASLLLVLQLAWGPAARSWKFLALSAGLAALTPASIVAPLLMPDFFAAPMILLISAGYISFPTLSMLLRSVIAVAIGICLLVHASHVPIAILLGAIASTIQYLRTRQTNQSVLPSIWIASVIVCALLINAGLERFAEKRIGKELHQPPFFTARAIDDGPGRSFLFKHCRKSPYEVCRFRSIILSNSRGGDHMNWDVNGSDNHGFGVYRVEGFDVAKKLREQNLSFARDAVLAEPLQQLWGSIGNFAYLLSSFSIEYVRFSFASTNTEWNSTLATLPNRAQCAAHPTDICGAMPILQLIHLFNFVVAIGAFLILVVCFRLFFRMRVNRQGMDERDLLLMLTCTGVILNAFVCGVLGGPYDRYQARVIWLVPAMAGAVILFSRDKLKIGEAFKR